MKELKMKRIDIVVISVLSVVYAAIAFFRLGDTVTPETAWTPQLHGEAVFDLGGHHNSVELWFYSGARHSQFFSVALSADGENFTFIQTGGEPFRYSTNSVFRWHNYALNWSVDFQYVKIVSNMWDLKLMEVAFKDSEDSQIPVQIITPDAVALIDEQHTLPDRYTFMNGTYFDEIYHPRTAYEIIHGLSLYETTHPPLGKVIISWGIRIFGMNPFGWRFMGTLAGVLMVPLMYVFAKFMFKSTLVAFFTAFLFTFDFMHFVQTRLATIDTYVVLFIIAQFYFMYKYCKTGVSEPLKKILPPLLFTGIFMGLGIASKWTGMYAGAGLAVIYCFVLVRHVKNDWRKSLKIVLWSVVFFGVVPAIIYVASYIPQFGDLGSLQAFFTAVWDNQLAMFNYHGVYVLESTHPFSSVWWEWPLMVRPIWYYSNRTPDGLSAGISAFGNPAVWWGGIAAFFYICYRYYRTRDFCALFLIVGYLAQYLPWMYVSRITFIYHYFTCVPFIVLMLGYAAYDIKDRRFGRQVICAYAAVTGVLFILFYPVLSGLPVKIDFVVDVLRWMPGWVLAV